MVYRVGRTARTQKRPPVGGHNERTIIMARRTRTTTPTTTDTTPMPEVSVDTSAPVATVEPTADVAPADVPAVPEFPATFTPDGNRAAVIAATRTVGDVTGPRFTDPGIIAALTCPAAVAIAAGMAAVRGVVRTADAIDAARATFDTAATAVSAPTSAATVNVGRYTGRKIMDGQNVMYAIASIVRATDAEIAVAWRSEWPGAKCNFAVRNDHVTTTRPVVNRGGHGWTNGHNGTPDVVTAWGGPFRAYRAGD